LIARACSVPSGALLQVYVARQGCYTDCFAVASPATVPLQAFVTAFYTTWLFRAERLVLRLASRRPITDAQVRALAAGAADSFAAWTVEAREADQILLCDLAGHTRSWLAVSPEDGGGTRLTFGSAVVPPAGRRLSRAMRALIPLHRVYARALLRLAARRLRHSLEAAE